MTRFMGRLSKWFLGFDNRHINGLASPLPLWERSQCIDRCVAGEGLRTIEGDGPLTPTLSRRGRGSSLPMRPQTTLSRASNTHIPNTATARIGEAVPPRHFIGSPMNVKGPAPINDSRLHRLSIWVMPSSKQAL